MNLIIGGDLAPTNINASLFNNGDIESLLGSKLKNIWNSADMHVFNLEAPLTDKETPIDKQGPNLLAPTTTIKGIKELNPTLVTLANNHILDQGIQGLHSTEKLFKEYNISHVGAGNNLEEASKPYIIKKNGVKLGIYTCAEHEFTIATEKEPGANPFDPLESLDHIKQLKSKCDYVIVLYHGGKEHYRYPSPYLQKTCRKLVQKGADIVICQHSHCIGAYEEIKDSTIIYGQGNFIFNNGKKNEYWNTSLLVNVQVSNRLNIEYIPIVKNKWGTELATDKKSKEILDNFEQRSIKIKEPEFIENEYRKYARENMKNYIRNISGFGKWKSRLDRKLLNNALLKRKLKHEQYLLKMQNYIECEAHRELLLKGIKDYLDID